MNKFTVALKWYFALTKRLLKKPAFLIALILIPVITISVTVISKEESGIMTIAISAEDLDDEIYKGIVTTLNNEESSILYKEYSSPEKAKEAVERGKADSAWIFKEDISGKIKESVWENKDIPFAEVLVTKDSIFHKLAREKLYSLLYEHYSREVTLKIGSEEKVFKKADVDVDEVLNSYFDEYSKSLDKGLINFTFLNNENKELDDINYIASPLRGLLAVALTLCCYAAMMFSLHDENKGKYSMFSISKRLFLHYSNCFAAAILVAVMIFISLLVTRNIDNVITELCATVLLVFGAVFFCTFIGIICRTPGRMCIMLPLVSVMMLALCPIFINVNSMDWLSVCLPPTLYLRSCVVSHSYLLQMLIYVAVGYVLSFLSYKALNRE